MKKDNSSGYNIEQASRLAILLLLKLTMYGVEAALNLVAFIPFRT